MGLADADVTEATSTTDGPGARPRRTRWLVAAVLAVLTVLGALVLSTDGSGDPGEPPPGALTPAPSGLQPSAATTGVPAGTTLTVHEGDLTIRRPGTVVEGLDVHGFITVEAPNVTIRDSVVRGGEATYNRGVITNYGHANLLVEDVEIVPAAETVWQDGGKGSDFTLNRVHVTGNVDSVKVHGGGRVLVQNSLLEDTTYYAEDPNQGGGTSHTDGVQVLDGTDITILNNTTRGHRNLAVLGAANKGDTTDLVVDGNWLDGGHCTVKLEEFAGHRLEATVTDNVFGPHRDVAGCEINVTSGTEVIARGNRSAVDGDEIALVRTVD